MLPEVVASGVIGALIGAALDRISRRIETRPLFRVALGAYQDQEGYGLHLHVENVGLEPIPEYEICIYHPSRGAFSPFIREGSVTYPQYPTQKHTFKFLTVPRPGAKQERSWVEKWFESTPGEIYSNKQFSDFEFRILLKNSETIMFRSVAFGCTVAAMAYETLSGVAAERSRPEVMYISKAPPWTEWIRRRRAKRMLQNPVRISY